ncbi:hypothetical protein HPB47_001848, partial [Ixodes persulcatus]
PSNRHTHTLIITPDAPDIDSHVFHLWEARRCLSKQWRRQRHNRKFKLRIAQLTVEAATYAANLTGQNWNTLCEKHNGTLGTARTWSLHRHLIQPGQAISERAKDIHKLLYLTTQCNQIMHMLRRVSNRRNGLIEADALRLVQALIHTRLLYHLPYHYLNQTEHKRMSTLLRKAQKMALGLPVRTAT